ncbi:hypothetical protein ABFS82_01G066900 [Erythranthe guttata]
MNQSEGNNSALEEPNRRETDKLDESNKKQEQRIRNLETKAIQNVNLYFIFQAVVLLASTTAAASSSTTAAATCRRWWIPFTLSLLAAITNFLSLSTTVSAVLKSREELDQNLSDLASMKSNQTRRDPVSPGDIPQNIPGGDHQIIVRPKADNFINKWKRRSVVYFLVGLFVGFSAVVMYGCYNILC